MATSKQVVYRSSVSGRFITERTADRNPRETERQVIRHPQPAKQPTKK